MAAKHKGGHRRPDSPGKVQVSFQMDEDTYARITGLARDYRTSIAEQCRVLLEFGLEGAGPEDK